MTRINAVRNIAETRSSVSRGSASRSSVTRSSVAWGKHTGALIFAAVLIVCSLTVGCSSDSNSDKPKSVTSNQIPAPQIPSAVLPVPAPAMQAAAKPASKKVVSKKPATVNYADKTYGVTFEYPRRYAIETGDAAADLLASNSMAMNFVEPGGVALAAVELPETGFANTDFSSAFFNVSVHKSLTADQCTEFAVPQPKGTAVASSTESVSSPVATSSAAPSAASSAASPTTSAAASSASPAATPAESASTPSQPATTQSAAVQSAPPEQTSAAKASSDPASNSKLILGDLELRATEAVSGEGTRQSDSKYFHVYQNGGCYEFALNVTTDASEDGIVKHVDRDKVFNRLEQILATVKIAPVAPEATAEAPTPTPAATPAQ
jgi:hypothetical protein